MFGVGAKKVFAHSIDDASKALKDETRLLLAMALALFFVSQAIINAGLDHNATAHNHGLRIAGYVVAAVLVVVVGLVATGVSSLIFTAFMAAVALVLVARSIKEERSAAA
jgi:hypothetical protein